eukprot:TRINITY_DN16515_c0_g1_i1.p1 TRINITY_DN16515_c0_g1~~TRINITY_DN16515_c0_g1_i1.p1  ORF type:complete len:373 (-),score=89.38 TRINITY_DN16515_c0_g1_i1:199-1317(-)
MANAMEDGAHKLALSKSLVMDSIHHKGTSVGMGMDGWVIDYNRQGEVIEAHSLAITGVQKTISKMQQQVKAMARTMTAANLESIHQDRAKMCDALREEMEKHRYEMKEQIMHVFTKEVEHLASKRTELSKRVDALEEKLIDLVMAKTEEATQQRVKLELAVDKVSMRCNEAERSIVSECSRVKDFCNSMDTETHKAMHKLRLSIEEERSAREKALQVKNIGIDRLTESVRSYQDNAQLELKRSLERLESKLMDKVAAVGNDLELDKEALNALTKSFESMNREIGARVHGEVDLAIKAYEQESDRKMAAVARFFPEMKMAMEAERTTRSQAVEELKRSLAAERKERDLDDHRILAMIRSTLGTLQKMHEPEIK